MIPEQVKKRINDHIMECYPVATDWKFEELQKQFRDIAYEAAQFGYNFDRWIKIESEADLPEESGKYFVCCGNGRNYWAIWYDKSLGKFNTPFAEFSPVTHWQPITPPKD